MKPITSRPLDWIDQAPVVVTRTRRMAASTDRVWEAIADHEGWPAWFGVLTKVEVLGRGVGVGGGRRVHIGSIAVDEEFLVWEPGAHFAFTVTHASRPVLRSMVEDIRLTAEGDSATTVRYTQAVEPVAARVVAPLLRRQLSKELEKGLAGLAAHVGG